MQLQEAKKIAVDLCYRLQPYCTRINIAGSIRRQKREVKDIEIVCLPKIVEMKDLFGDVQSCAIDAGFNGIVNQSGDILKGNTTGRYMQIVLPQGINLDLFMPEANDYYRQLAIRTGSAEYAHKVIASGWLKKGWCGSDKGLRKQSDCFKDKAGNWKCGKEHAEPPPAWESEEAFFEWAGISYIHPSQRQELIM